MYRIVCFGDSNTWGYDPETKKRFPDTVRWTGVMQRELGEGYLVLEEGLNGRTTVWEDPIELHKKGSAYLPPCLESHKPLDLVVIMLGTNDMKKRFSLSAPDVAGGARVLVDIARKSETGRDGAAPKILLICPPPIARLTEFAQMFEGAKDVSLQLDAYYRQEAAEAGCDYLFAGHVLSSSDIDGIHFEADGHDLLGKAVAGKARRILE